MMSGLLRKRPSWCAAANYRDGPKPEVAVLFDHLVGDRKYTRRNSQGERLGGLEIDDQLELGWLLDREIAGLRTTQNLVDVVCRAPEPFRGAWSVGHERAGFDDNRVLKIVGSRAPSAEVRMLVRLATMS